MEEVIGRNVGRSVVQDRVKVTHAGIDEEYGVENVVRVRAAFMKGYSGFQGGLPESQRGPTLQFTSGIRDCKRCCVDTSQRRAQDGCAVFRRCDGASCTHMTLTCECQCAEEG